MKKQHDAANLANELEGSSAFFRARQSETAQPVSPTAPADQPRQRPTTRPTDASTTAATDPGAAPSTSRPEPRPAQRSAHRSLQRRSFEFYVDQLETLKAWSLQAQLLGEKTSMSEMIRAALDRYLRDEASFHQPADDPTTQSPDASSSGADA